MCSRPAGLYIIGFFFVSKDKTEKKKNRNPFSFLAWGDGLVEVLAAE